MVVTQIAEVTNSRSKIYIDDAFAFVLYKGELRHYKIREGEVITQDVVNEILQTVLPKRAKFRGMSLLKSRPYTEKQMYDKLKQGFYPEQVIREAIEYLMSFGYIDDVQYARNYVDYHSNVKSRRRLEQDLMQKGISKQEIQKAFQNWEKEGGEVDESAQIQTWIRKKKYDVHTADLKEKQRMAAFLFRKGFDAGSIQKALKCEVFF